ncbi:hypothetical protein [Streptomyces scabiei]|uniref:hypothetical protein n=1 Tax=Streptomyces scabiei TaxID=1930 RepID=UPI00131ACFDC|nr:hypothetical protein [Streptomyces scabiei]
MPRTVDNLDGYKYRTTQAYDPPLPRRPCDLIGDKAAQNSGGDAPQSGVDTYLTD